MLVRTKNVRDAVLDDVDFDVSHPRYLSHVQRLARSKSQVATISFSGQLTEFQPKEDAISGIHPTTEAITNDLAEILLGLFIPWQDLGPLLCRSKEQGKNHSQIWATVEPTLSLHITEISQEILTYCESPRKIVRQTQSYANQPPRALLMTPMTTIWE